MPRRKDTAHRPSQAHLEFVKTKDGRRVRNTAYTGPASKQKGGAAQGLAPKPATKADTDSEAESRVTTSLSNMPLAYMVPDLTDHVKAETATTFDDGSFSSAKFDKPVRIFAASGNDYYVESVHVVHDTTDLDTVRETLAESFEDLKVRKPQPETRPTDFDGRYKRLVITPDDEYVVDGGTWTSPINGSPIVSSALVSLRNDDWVTVKQGERFDAKGIAQLMASEVSKAINGS